MKKKIIILLIIFLTIPVISYSENVLLYCHEGFGPLDEKYMADIGYYERAKFSVFVAVFSDENGDPPIASADVEIIKQIAEGLIDHGYTVSLVGVSLGGYRALQAFLRYPELFDRAVIYMAPINIDDITDLNEWAKNHPEDVGMALAYFTEIESPIELARQGYGEGLSDRILLIYGGRDKLCPKKDCLLFEELTGSECIIYNRAGHNVSMNRNAIRMAIEFLK